MARSPFHPFHFEIDKNTQADLDEYTTESLDTLFNHDKIKGLFVLNSENDRVFNKEKWNETLDTFHSWRDKYVKREAEIEEAINKGETPAKYEGDPKDDPANYKYMYPDDLESFLSHYDQEQAANILNSYQEIANKAPELKDKFSTLFGMYEQIERSKNYQRDGDKNQLNFAIKKGNDGSHLALLTMKNFGGLGLNFTIENGRSILFDDNKPLTQAQVAEFARFFKDQGFHISDFKGLEDVKVVDDHDANKEIGSFEELYLAHTSADLDNMSLDELSKLADQQPNNPIVQEALQQKLAHDEANGGDDTGRVADATPETSGPFTDYINTYFNGKTPNFTMRGFKNAVYARAGIMRVEKRCITTRRLADGSLAICFYGSENDLRKDGTMDKEGVVRHTKKCMFVASPGKPPTVGLYLPQGAKMETGYAKALIGALKQQGYPYINIPGAGVIGSDVFEAFLKACGDQLAIPTGADLDVTHFQTMLKAATADDSEKADIKDILLWKMALVERMNEQLVRSNNNSKIKDLRDQVEGDIRLQKFSTDYLPMFKKYFEKETQEKFEKYGGRAWNELDSAAAKQSLARVIDAVRTGEYVNAKGETVKLDFDYLCKDPAKEAKNEAVLKELFEQGIKEAYPRVVKEFDNILHKGTAASGTTDEDATNNDDDSDNRSLDDSIKASDIKSALQKVEGNASTYLDDAIKRAKATGSKCGDMEVKGLKTYGYVPKLEASKKNARGQITHYDTSVLLKHPTPLRSTPRTGDGRSGSGRE